MIEAARTLTGEAPAEDFIGSLIARGKKDLERAADLAVRFEAYADTGELEIPRELNILNSRISEIKAGDVRVLFYSASQSGCGTVRLTNGFIKKSARTPRKHIDKAEWVRREDIMS